MKDNKFHMILVADLHYGAGNDESLNKEANEILLKKIKKCGKSLDYFEILGDSSHRQLSMNEKAGKYQSSLFHSINNLSMENNFYFRILKGTHRHDYTQLEMYRKLELINPKFKIFNTAEVDNFKLEGCWDLSILQLPEEYVDDEFYYEPFLKKKKDENLYDFTMVHGTFDFAGYVSKLCESEKQMKNAITFKSKDFKDLNYGCTFSGHIHTVMDYNNVFYCGSFSRFAFGEEEPKGFYEVFYDVETLETEINFIENTLAPTYITIDETFLEGKSSKDRIKKLNDIKKKYDYIRIKTIENLDNKEELEILKEMSKKDSSLKVDIKKNDEEKIDHTYDFLLDDKLTKPKKMIEFSKIKLKEDITEEQIKHVFEKADVEDIDVFFNTP